MTHYTHPTYIKWNTFLELDFGLKTSASWIIWDIGFRLPGFFISASWIIWDIRFHLPGFFVSVWGFRLSGFFILDSWIIWDIGFQLPGLFGILVKAIRENVNYISLHGGHGSLTDTKRIIRLYTEESESLAPVIDDLTLQREFVVFDLRRSKSDPLSIRVRWDTSLSSITEQSQFNPSSISVQSQFDPSLNPVRSQSEPSSITVRSKFSPYGQKAVFEAKKGGHLIEFARVFPSPKECQHLLVPGVLAKNADTWIKYVFREAYGLSGKTLGADFQDFLAKVQGRTAKTETLKTENVKELFSRYEALKATWTIEHYK
ncbi:hypothetical protein GLOIN_2v1874888 [Rhizophagus irregularis DAOM 181602=DAOM 197198]|nr:hypothetical protein GLOIN_2v1874888 [Rhizophagus irregularis DAOM 181602=DAOM 197198]